MAEIDMRLVLAPPVRIACSVPFCQRTTKLQCSEWICGKHWSLIPNLRRSAYLRSRREAVRAGHWPEHTDRLWRRVKQIAIERAMGI